MINTTKRAVAVLMPLLLMSGMAAQTQRPRLTLVIQGCTVETPVIQMQGRTLVDVQDLARITNGSLSFDRDQIIQPMPRCDASKTAGDDTGKSRFSGTFTKAGIAAMTSIREWGGILMITVQNGYPVGNTMAGNAIMSIAANSWHRCSPMLPSRMTWRVTRVKIARCSVNSLGAART